MSVTALRERLRQRKELPEPAERRRLRLAAGVTLVEVADAVGVTPWAVRLWELGEREPRGPNLEQYVAVLRLLREAGGAEP